MPALGTVVLTDAATPTPVDHSFAPRSGVDAKGVATYARSTGVPLGDETLTVSVVKTTVGRRKVTIKLAVPVVATAVVNGVNDPTILRVAYCNIDFSFDQKSSTQERKDIRAMVTDLLGNGQGFAAAIIDDLEAVY
jgi:hypothetical protein